MLGEGAKIDLTVTCTYEEIECLASAANFNETRIETSYNIGDDSFEVPFPLLITSPDCGETQLPELVSYNLELLNKDIEVEFGTLVSVNLDERIFMIHKSTDLSLVDRLLTFRMTARVRDIADEIPLVLLV